MRKRSKRGGVDYWQSYSDMMAAMFLMFVLIMSVLFIQSQEQNIQLEEQKQQINRILGVKPELIADLKKELEGFEVYIDESTGDIEFKSDILFDYNMNDLKPVGTEFLSGFMPKYLNVILSEKYLPSIAEIIIEGHTDDIGGYLSNLTLSQERALSVAEFVVGENSPFVSGTEREMLRKIITVTGKSYTNPIYIDESKSQIDRDRSRRVELKFRLKDDETIEQLRKMLN